MIIRLIHSIGGDVRGKELFLFARWKIVRFFIQKRSIGRFFFKCVQLNAFEKQTNKKYNEHTPLKHRWVVIEVS